MDLRSTAPAAVTFALPVAPNSALTPLFVMGMGRSGTTNTLRVLNCHPKVMLTGEIALAVLKQFFALLDKLDQSTQGKPQLEEGWLERKADFIFTSFGYMAKLGHGQLGKYGDAVYLGHKSPKLEFIFGEYEAHFASVGMKPLYVYCTRNPFDCWRSYRSQPWNAYPDVDRFLQDYDLSHRRLRRMRKKAPSRVFLMELDVLKAAPDPFAFYQEKLYALLGLDMDDRTRQRIRKIHYESKRGSEARTIPDADRARIEDYLSAPEKNDIDSA